MSLRHLVPRPLLPFSSAGENQIGKEERREHRTGPERFDARVPPNSRNLRQRSPDDSHSRQDPPVMLAGALFPSPSDSPNHPPSLTSTRTGRVSQWDDGLVVSRRSLLASIGQAPIERTSEGRASRRLLPRLLYPSFTLPLPREKDRNEESAREEERRW